MWLKIMLGLVVLAIGGPVHLELMQQARDTDGTVFWPAYFHSEDPPGYAIREQIILNSAYYKHRTPEPLETSAWNSQPSWNSGRAVAGDVIVTQIDRALLEVITWASARKKLNSGNLSWSEVDKYKKNMMSKLEQEFPISTTRIFVAMFFPLTGEYADWFRFRLTAIGENSAFLAGSGNKFDATSIEDCPTFTMYHNSSPFVCLLGFPISDGVGSPIANLTIPVHYDIRLNSGSVVWLPARNSSTIVVRVDRSSAQVVNLIANHFIRREMSLNEAKRQTDTIGVLFGQHAVNLVQNVAVTLITSLISRRFSHMGL